MLPTKRSGPGILGNPSFRGRCFRGSRPTDSPESRSADIARSSPAGLVVRMNRLTLYLVPNRGQGTFSVHNLVPEIQSEQDQLVLNGVEFMSQSPFNVASIGIGWWSDVLADAARGVGTTEVGGEGATESLAVVKAGIKSVREGRHVEVTEILASDD